MGKIAPGVVVLSLVIGTAPPVGAQAVRGTVRNWTSGSALERAFVTLLDTTGAPVLLVRTDDRGRFSLDTREAGIYAVAAEQTGFKRTVSAWLQLKPGETLDVTLRLAPLAQVLPQVTIAAQRDSLMELSVSGVPLRTLAGTVVTQAEVEQAATGTARMTEVIQNLRIPSVALRHYKINKNDSRLDGDRTCLAQTRAPSGTGTFARGNEGSCIAVVIDGQRLSTDDLFKLDDFITPDRVKAVVMLRAAEASVLYGTGAQNGVLLILTKSGH